MPTYKIPMLDADVEAMVSSAPFAAGASRETFDVPGDSAVVVKRAKAYPGPNVTEWLVWTAIEGSDLEPIFGRCLTVSISGKYLVMERLADTTAAQTGLFPKIPYWLTDRKRSAFGVDRQGRVKIRDYGSLSLGDWLGRAHRELLPY